MSYTLRRFKLRSNSFFKSLEASEGRTCNLHRDGQLRGFSEIILNFSLMDAKNEKKKVGFENFKTIV